MDSIDAGNLLWVRKLNTIFTVKTIQSEKYIEKQTAR